MASSKACCEHCEKSTAHSIRWKRIIATAYRARTEPDDGAKHPRVLRTVWPTYHEIFRAPPEYSRDVWRRRRTMSRNHGRRDRAQPLRLSSRNASDVTVDQPPDRGAPLRRGGDA